MDDPLHTLPITIIAIPAPSSPQVAGSGALAVMIGASPSNSPVTPLNAGPVVTAPFEVLTVSTSYGPPGLSAPPYNTETPFHISAPSGVAVDPTSVAAPVVRLRV